MIKKHSIIIIPGLGDKTKPVQFLIEHWKIYGLNPIIYSVGWRDGESQFLPKLYKLLSLIDKLKRNGDTVSLIGTSAGGSAVLNAFFERKNVIHKVINICGRLRTGPIKGFRSFKSKTSSSPTFAQSVILAESREPFLNLNDRKKIMTVRSMFGDELVPPETTNIDGAHNIRVPMIGHVMSIGAALTIFSKPIVEFLTD
jgi:hypothetical protein